MNYSSTDFTDCLAAGPTMPEGFNDKNKTLIMNDANGSGGSAVVIALRGGKGCHAETRGHGENLREKMNYSNTE